MAIKWKSPPPFRHKTRSNLRHEKVQQVKLTDTATTSCEQEYFLKKRDRIKGPTTASCGATVDERLFISLVYCGLWSAAIAAIYIAATVREPHYTRDSFSPLCTVAPPQLALMRRNWSPFIRSRKKREPVPVEIRVKMVEQAKIQQYNMRGC